MASWAACQIHSQRERLAHHFLALAGFTTWFPQVRERKIIRGRRQDVLLPLFPGYTFILITLQWSAAHYAPGVVRLVMDGARPARVPDQVIEALQAREKNGVIDLPKPPPKLRVGARVRVTGGPFGGHIGLVAGMSPRERVVVLLSLLGSQQRVEMAASDVEVVAKK